VIFSIGLFLIGLVLSLIVLLARAVS